MKKLVTETRKSDGSRHKLLTRGMGLIILLVMYFNIVPQIIYRRADYTSILLFTNPMVMIAGWYILGGKNFTRAGISEKVNVHRALKITILHSILLVMANVSISMTAKVLANWEVIYRNQKDIIVSVNSTVKHMLFIFIAIAVITLIISIWQYRNSSMEYYSVVCQSIGWLCMTVAYLIRIEQLSHAVLEAWILEYEWVYVESLAFASAYLVYCSFERKKKQRQR